MLPDELRPRSPARALAVLAFASNIYFWKHADYFAPDAEENPLLHTWSLAVEEQYYLLVPPLILLLWYFARQAAGAGHAARRRSRSLALAEIGWRMRPEANFYLLPTRAWELGIGSLVAWRCCAGRRPARRGGSGRRPRWPGSRRPRGGATCSTRALPFPSAYALVPTVGAALVIVFAARGTLAGRLLSLRPVVFVGLISYSAYLWHQPLFAFARIAAPRWPGPAAMLALAAATFLLAALTWRFVERPFRDRRPCSTRGLVRRRRQQRALALLATP